MTNFDEWFNLTDESRSPELKEPMRLAYEAGEAKAKAGNEFRRLGETIGDAVARLPCDYRIEIDLSCEEIRLCLVDPDGTGVNYGHSGRPLADEINRMIDAASEDAKRRGEG